MSYSETEARVIKGGSVQRRGSQHRKALIVLWIRIKLRYGTIKVQVVNIPLMNVPFAPSNTFGCSRIIRTPSPASALLLREKPAVVHTRSGDFEPYTPISTRVHKPVVKF
jgi:hypothetical protein